MKCQLRISWKNPLLTHTNVLAVLLQAGVKTCTVTPGWSLCTETPSSQAEIERSVVIDLYASDKENITDVLWPALRDSLGLICMHVHEFGRGFTGCVHNYIGESKCPHDRVAASEVSSAILWADLVS